MFYVKTGLYKYIFVVVIPKEGQAKPSFGMTLTMNFIYMYINTYCCEPGSGVSSKLTRRVSRPDKPTGLKPVGWTCLTTNYNTKGYHLI